LRMSGDIGPLPPPYALLAWAALPLYLQVAVPDCASKHPLKTDTDHFVELLMEATSARLTLCN